MDSGPKKISDPDSVMADVAMNFDVATDREGVSVGVKGEFVFRAGDLAPWLTCPGCWYPMGKQYEMALLAGRDQLACPECGAVFGGEAEAIKQYKSAKAKNEQWHLWWLMPSIAFLSMSVPVANCLGLFGVCPVLCLLSLKVGQQAARQHASYCAVVKGMGEAAYEKQRVRIWCAVFVLAHIAMIVAGGFVGLVCGLLIFRW